jgi:tetratricopeptide (TPR) repeat protein
MQLGAFLLIGLCAAGSPPQRAAGGSSGPTDYLIELRQIDEAGSSVQGGAPGTPHDAGPDLRKLHLSFRRASLIGSYSELEKVGDRVDECLKTLGPSDDLLLLRGKLHLAFHQLEAAKQDLANLRELAGSSRIESLAADVDFQDGRYEECRRRLERAVRTRPTWDNLARLAFLRAKTGDVEGADRLYERSEEEITAKEMRSFAWVELQRGLLDLGRGRYEDAAAHYDRAGRAYSGYWLVDEHVAELLAASGKLDRATALYEDVIARAPRPEIIQSLGDLYLFMGQRQRAAEQHAKALAAFLESAGHGGVHYFHHLAAYYADVLEDGAESGKWARKDLALRTNYATREAVAWALYRSGQFDDALREVDRALAYGIIDAHLFYHAGMIYLSAGRTDTGKKLLQKTAELNPRYHDFHVHR